MTIEEMSDEEFDKLTDEQIEAHIAGQEERHSNLTPKLCPLCNVAEKDGKLQYGQRHMETVIVKTYQCGSSIVTDYRGEGQELFETEACKLLKEKLSEKQ